MSIEDVVAEAQKHFKDLKLICELPAGDWKLCSYQGHILAVCPDHQPRFIRPDGTVEILTGQ